MRGSTDRPTAAAAHRRLICPADGDGMTSWRRTATAGAALAAALFAIGCGVDRAPGNDPVRAVKDFLIDGVVDHNGYDACAFMTTDRQRAAAGRARGLECRQAFDLASLELGGKPIDTAREIDRLPARSNVRGDRAWVQVGREGDAVEFRLVKANAHENAQFLAPDTNWRIAGGALARILHGRA